MEDKTCDVCRNDYNEKDHVKCPLHLSSNGKFHYMCFDCIIRIKNKKCPYCKEDFLFEINMEVYMNNTIYGACKKGDSEKALDLLRNNKYDKIDYIDKDDYTTLMWACRNNLSEVALEILKLDMNKSLPERINKYGCTALIFATDNKMSEVSFELIKLGREKCIPQQIYNRDTALIHACANRLSGVALELLKFGPEYCPLKLVGSCGNTALMLACQHDLEEVALEIIKFGPDKCFPEYVNIYIVNNAINFLKVLINNDLDEVDNIFKKGDTALLWACARLPKVALELIKFGSEYCIPQQIDENHDTALTLACENNYPEVALELIKFGPEKCLPQIFNRNRDNALIIACVNKLSVVALELINLGPEYCLPDHRDNNDKTALDYATENNLTDVIEELNKIMNKEDSQASKKMKI
jgi:ankyrin repeat protein